MKSTQVWHFRMNREGRTCIARETRSQQGSMRGVLVEMLRMKERLEVEHVSDVALMREFPIDILHADESAGEMGTISLKAAAHQYLIHAAVAGSSHEAFDLLAKICRPKQALRERIEANFTDKGKP